MEQDKELKAINEILLALDVLDEPSKARVIKYVLERIGVSGIQNSPSTSTSKEIVKLMPHQTEANDIDIRILKEKKNPKSAIQMAVLVAYYLKELAPIDERKDSIGTNDIEKYFNQAKFRFPTGKNKFLDPLNNAKNAGYLESAARGEYKLNPVGYNLAVHGLPESENSRNRKKTKKAKPKKKK